MRLSQNFQKPYGNETEPVNIVVLLHGRNSNPTQFWKIIKQIQQQLPQVYVFAPHQNQGDATINDDAGSVYREFQEHFKEFLSTGRKFSLVVVGISKGGLTAAEFITKLNHNMTTLITISSPLHGTHTASFAFWTKNTKIELARGSHACRRTVGNLENLHKSGKLKLYHVAPVIDQLIIPVTSTVVSYVDDIYVHTEYTSHNIIQLNDKVMGWVVDKIQENV